MTQFNFGLSPDTLKEISQDIADLRICGLSDIEISDIIGRALQLSGAFDFVSQFQLITSLVRVEYPERFLLISNTHEAK